MPPTLPHRAARLALALACGAPALADSYTSSAPAVAIGSSGAPAVLTLQVPDSFAIADVNVVVRAQHPDVGQLALRVRHPDGTTVVLADHAAGGAGLRYACFDDQAAQAFAQGAPPYAGEFVPAEPLAAFAGKDAQGTWSLEVLDDVPHDPGVLHAFSLAFDGLTRVYAGPPLPIVAFAPTVARVAVDVPFTVADVEATFEFDYATFDLVRPTVRSPQGETEALMGYLTGPGGYTLVYAKMISATFDDQGAVPLVPPALAPFTGRWRTPGGAALAALAGEAALGEWALVAAFDEFDCCGTFYGGWLHFTASDACLSTAASSAPYGAGTAGTLGVPGLALDAPPRIGTSFSVLAGNASGVPAPGALLVGPAPAALPLLGGTLLVAEPALLPLHAPAAGLALPVALPADTAQCGQAVHLQWAHGDAGAPQGVAFSSGLALVLGS